MKTKTSSKAQSKVSAKKKASRVKAGSSQAAADQRKVDFALAFIANKKNATRAAIKAGYSEKTADQQGSRLLKHVKVKALIAEAAEKSAIIAGLDINRTLREVARLSYSDPRKMYRPDGSLIPVHELDDDTAASIASIEVDEITAGGAVRGYTKKVKHWDKNAALEKAMKHHGLYEKDNSQRGESLSLKIELV